MGVFADGVHCILVQPFQALAQGIAVFLNQQPVAAILHIFRSAGTLYQYTAQAAGRRLPDHQAVGIEGGWEKEQIRPAVPGPKGFTVVDGTGEEDPVSQVHRFAVGLYLVKVSAAANKDHPVFLSLRLESRQGIQNDFQALVPHDPANKQIAGNVFRQVESSGGSSYGLLAHPPPRQVYTVMHDDAVPFVTQGTEILCRPLANGPYLVAGVDIFQQCPLAALLKRFGANHIGNINIELGVIGQHQRHIQHLPQFPGHHGRHDGAVCME